MADNAIRINIDFNSDNAQASIDDITEQLEKGLDELFKTGQSFKFSIDTKSLADARAQVEEAFENVHTNINITELQDNIKASENDIKQMETQILKLNKELDKQADAFDKIEANIAGENNELKKQKNALEQNLKTLFEQIKAKKEAYDATGKGGMELDAMFRQYKAIASEISNINSKLKQNENALKSENASYQQNLNYVEQQQTALEKLKKTNEQNKQTLESELQARQLAKQAVANLASTADNLKNMSFGQGLKDAMQGALPLSQQWEQFSERFGEKGAQAIKTFLDGYDKIIAKASAVKSSISNAFSNAKEILKNAIQNPAQAWDNFAQKGLDVISSIANGFKSLANNGIGKLTAGLKFVASNGIAKLKEGIKDLPSKLKSAGAVAKTALANGVKKAWTNAKGLAKAVGANLLKSVKNIASRFSGMGKSADSLRKKVLKIGLAMVGMRGLMGGLRQIVKSALSDNQQLQAQLTAVKGVLAEALTPVINLLIQGLSTAVSVADKLYQIFTGTSLVAKYNTKQAEKTAKSTKETAKNSEKQLASFDKINKLSANASEENNNSSDNDTAELFTASSLSTGITDFIESLKNAIQSGDWFGVGETLGKGLNSIIQKGLSLDWDAIREKVNTTMSNIADAINGFVVTVDWNNVGKLIGEFFETVGEAIGTFATSIDYVAVGKAVSDMLNGIMNNVDWKKLTGYITDFADKAVAGLDKFFTEFDWEKLGTIFSDFANSIINIDWGNVAKTLSDGINGIWTSVNTFLEETDWSKLGEDIAEFFKGIKWEDVVKNIFTTLFDAIGAGADLLNGFFENIDDNGETANNIGESIVDWIKNYDWESFALKLAKLVLNLVTAPLKAYKFAYQLSKAIWSAILGTNSDDNDTELKTNAEEKGNTAGTGVASGIFTGITDYFANKKSELTTSWNTFTAGVKEKTAEMKAKIMQKWSDIKDDWNELTANVKEKTAEMKAKVKQKWADLKNDWNKLTENIKSKTADFKGRIATKWSDLKSKWDNLTKNIKSKTVSFKAELKDKVTTVIQGILNNARSLINKLIQYLKKHKVIGKIPAVKEMTYISPIKLAKGGIVNVPKRGVQVTAGEDGAEAVLPLEKNTEWQDQLANKTAQKVMSMFTGITLVNQMDSRELSREFVALNSRNMFIKNGAG